MCGGHVLMLTRMLGADAAYLTDAMFLEMHQVSMTWR